MNARDHTGKPCYWCRRTLLPPMSHNHHALSATTDHVRSRPECTSKKEYIDPKNKVPACYECNQRRSREWVEKHAAGLVFRTPFSEFDKAMRKLQREETIAGQKRAKDLAAEKALFNRRVHVVVPPELSEAWK